MGLPQQQHDEQESSVVRLAKEKASQAIQKQGRKLLKSAGKKIAKLAVKAIANAIALLTKMIIGFLGSIGLPALGVILGIILVVIVFMMASSWIYGGDGANLTGPDKEIQQYILDKSHATVDMSRPEQRKFRVPEKLIASVIQIDSMLKGNEDHKQLINKMATALKPNIDYEDYNEWKETHTTVCRDGVCGETKVVKEDNWKSKITFAKYWDGNTDYTYTPYITPWETKVNIDYETEKYTVTEEYVDTIKQSDTKYIIKPVEKKVTEEYIEWSIEPKYSGGEEICCIYKPVKKTREVTKIVYEKVPVEIINEIPVVKTREVEKERIIEVKTTIKTRYQRFDVAENAITDYSKFDEIMNGMKMGIKDKKLIEALYASAGGQVTYTEWLGSIGGFTGNSGFNGTVIPGAGVPTQFMQYYLDAEKKYGVSWYVLCAVHFVETGFSTHPTMTSSVGAIGHMQFMPATWAGWKYNIGGGLVSSSLDITNLSVIASGGGYGRDGDGDGKADPWNVADSIHTAAYYLAKNGYASDARKAIWQYNHANWYVDKVLANAEKFRAEAVYNPADGEMPQITTGAFMRPAMGEITSGFGARWGKFHDGVDIAKPGTVPVVAAADGEVVRSYLSSSYGNCVIIRHNLNGQQFESLYAHLQNRAVQTGATVTKGQFIGNMGSTGDSTGQHLHFELHKGSWNISKSDKVNPVLYIQF